MQKPFAALVFLVVAGGGCAGGTTAECASQADCAPIDAPCDACPGAGEGLCREGQCADREADAVDVVAAILRIEPRTLEVPSLVHVLADSSGPEGPFACAEAEAALGDGLNVLSVGFKNLSGGAQHTDVGLGRAPAGTLGLLLLGVDGPGGDGEVIATGCVADIDASGDVTLELVDLNGI